MAMITAGDFRKGVVFEMDGKPYTVVDFQHVKPGKGAAFVRTKYKDVISGSVREESFNPSAKFEAVEIEKKEMQYLYEDGGLYYFMDNETYEQTSLDSLRFLKENMNVKLASYKGKVFAVELPNFVEMEIKYTEPGFGGNTSSSNVTKPATLENGGEVRVPLFINTGDVIRIDTRTGEYMERV